MLKLHQSFQRLMRRVTQHIYIELYNTTVAFWLAHVAGSNFKGMNREPAVIHFKRAVSECKYYASWAYVGNREPAVIHFKMAVGDVKYYANSQAVSQQTHSSCITADALRVLVSLCAGFPYPLTARYAYTLLYST